MMNRCQVNEKSNQKDPLPANHFIDDRGRVFVGDWVPSPSPGDFVGSDDRGSRVCNHCLNWVYEST